MTQSIDAIDSYLRMGNKKLAILSLYDLVEKFKDDILNYKIDVIYKIIDKLLNDENSDVVDETESFILKSKNKLFYNLKNNLINKIFNSNNEKKLLILCRFLIETENPMPKKKINHIVNLLSQYTSNEVKLELVHIIGKYYTKLNNDNRWYLIKYSTDEDINIRKAILDTIDVEFMKLPPDIKYTIIENFSKDEEPKIRRSLVNIIENHVDELPKEYREDILLQLATDIKKKVRARVAYCLSYHINDIDKDKALEILGILSKDKYNDISSRAVTGIRRLKKND